tara:strand:+ start:3682 stop:3822 length:141 start_codon:yes stop_codon:yes gene_type:complete
VGFIWALKWDYGLALLAAKPSPLRMVALFYSGRYLFYKLPQPNQTN